MQKTESTEAHLKVTERISWSKSGKKEGPVLVFFVGVHGNEPAGVEAIEQVAEGLEEQYPEINGTVYAITGNIEALKQGVRYLDTDLNRLWETFNTNRDYSRLNGEKKPIEYLESLEIKRTIEQIINDHYDTANDFIFADLHTTSSQSCAFILLNDSIANRELARKFPVPQILGIEENIQGTLLSYINNLGFKAIGFEAGAHYAEISVQRSEAFLWLILDRLGLLKLAKDEVSKYEELLGAFDDVPDTYYEIINHKIVEDPNNFEMISGFENFDLVEEGTPLAYENGKLISAPVSGRIFMPLYQNVGHDGFLIIREVSTFWLNLSGYLRKSFIHKWLKYLPGVAIAGRQSFEVNLKVARFLVKNIFHLLGYRITPIDENTLICYRR